MKSIVIKNAQIVNRGKIFSGDVLIEQGRIAKVEAQINSSADIEIIAEGKYLIPGIIDDQVHFREPGFPQKANIASEARAAVAGGGNHLHGNAEYQTCSTHSGTPCRKI